VEPFDTGSSTAGGASLSLVGGLFCVLGVVADPVSVTPLVANILLVAGATLPIGSVVSGSIGMLLLGPGSVSSDLKRFRPRCIKLKETRNRLEHIVEKAPNDREKDGTKKNSIRTWRNSPSSEVVCQLVSLRVGWPVVDDLWRLR